MVIPTDPQCAHSPHAFKQQEQIGHVFLLTAGGDPWEDPKWQKYKWTVYR